VCSPKPGGRPNGEVIGEPSVRQRPARFEPEHPRYHRYEAYLVLARRVQGRLSR
jgi:hypothetical protein